MVTWSCCTLVNTRRGSLPCGGVAPGALPATNPREKSSGAASWEYITVKGCSYPRESSTNEPNDGTIDGYHHCLRPQVT